ncbi:hypothetical protein PKB_1290 [Pseudomonas knackmussii B13]|uniref:Uncharacterized protein n=1 Tax=Pseudomonas knackmussii (strain DSM 6978 / CCUG 54928 / LMG 23759 / B13) TaxID=1301098 RepID=A0A024HC70_PSEKB|nr:hypothetical protein [Pseudomonas knackmussii]CDF82655.1 hypothetical protein PKB_1290 [Pseudomonas knackmussii B13]
MAGINQLKSDLNALQTTDRQARSLSPQEPKGSRPATTGRGNWEEPASTGSVGGIASPIVETAARTYYAEQTLQSSDGLWSFRVKPIQQVTFHDSNGAEVLMIYAEPERE